jgi:hypothetical protein
MRGISCRLNGGRACESNEIVAAQSLTSLRDSRSRQIRLRSVEQETNLSKFAADEFPKRTDARI